MKKLIYIYDAYCPWCYAFTPVVKKIYEHYGSMLDYEVLSGGMIIDDQIKTIGGSDDSWNLKNGYAEITERTGAEFGEAFFHRIEMNESVMNSEIPARALAVFREQEIEVSPFDFVHRLLHQLFMAGQDPNDESFYRELAEHFHIDPELFISKMSEDHYKQAARYDFVLARQLQAEAFPRLYLQVSETHFHLISKGYSDYDRLVQIIDQIVEKE